MKRLLGLFGLGLALNSPGFAQRVRLTVDASEAAASLGVLKNESAHVLPSTASWEAIFATTPYRLLKARETAFNNTHFDDAFRAYLTSEETIAQAGELRDTLHVWEQANLEAAAERVLSYLPEGAQIRARVYPVIKPAKNSFVWSSADEPAIFLYLNPSLSTKQFENKVAHECHHIGLDSIHAQQEAVWKALSEPQQKAIQWLGGFGEGEAMLAAAGSADVHPHAQDDAAARAHWDAEMAHFNENLDAIQRFLLEILNGTIKDPNDIDRRAEPFYGEQGAWYTVGYRMAATVERRFGREALTNAMIDPRKLLIRYNRAAMEENERQEPKSAVWSSELLGKLDRK